MRPVRAALAVIIVATAVRAADPPTVLRAAGEASPFGWPYSSLSEATLDAAGELVFVGSSSALMERSAGALHARLGAGTMLSDGREVAGVGTPALGSDGCPLARVAFRAGGDAIVAACGGTPTVVLDAGTPAPGGGVLRAFDPVVFASGASVVAAGATLADGTSVLLRHDEQGLAELVRSGMPAPSGGTFAAFRLLGVSATGAVGFRGTVTDGPDGLFLARDGVVSTVALVGQSSPAGHSFASIGGGTLNANGAWAFRAALSDDRSGIFATGPNGSGLRTIAISGDPGPVANTSIDSFPSSTTPSINASGAIAFRVLLRGGDRPSGVFVDDGGALTTVATVRGTISGVGTVIRLRDPVLADDGSVVVSAIIGGAGPGLFAWRAGSFSALARFGDPTDADAGETRFRFGPALARASAESAVFLAQRDAVFRAMPGGPVQVVAYTGLATRAGGVMATLGPPTVDGRGTVFLAADLQGAEFNEALFAGDPTGLDIFVSPKRRLLGGGGIREFFPSDLDTLDRPIGAHRGVALAASLAGRVSEAVFVLPSKRRAIAIARTGQRVGGERLASLGTPSVGPSSRMAFLAALGRSGAATRLGIVSRGGGLRLAAVAGESTRTRAGAEFVAFGPPAAGQRGTVFRATLSTTAAEGIFIARGRERGAIAVTGDATPRLARLRSFGDPIVVGDDVWFLARIAGSVEPAGLYRVTVSAVPGRDDPPLALEPVLLPGDPAPASVGGVVVRIDGLRAGPSGAVTVVADVGAGSVPSAILLVGAPVS